MNKNDFFIDEENSILDAMRQLDMVAKKVLFITRKNEFVAALTDGDIRRWILNKGDLREKIKYVANYDPIYLKEEDKPKAKDYMRKHKVEALPIIDDKNNVTSIIFWNDEKLLFNRMPAVPVVIMAGGLGTRLYPYTKILPKPLIPIGEIPIAEHIINRFNVQGCKDFYLIVNHKKNMIKAYFNEVVKDYTVSYIDEEIPLGTGGGLSLLKGTIKEPFILSNCDILIDANYEKIYSHHLSEDNFITMVCSLKNIKIPYGVVEIGSDGSVEEIKEKPELSFFTNTGMYIVDQAVIEDLEINKKIDFPDIITKYKNIGKKIGVYPIGEKSWMDMGQLDELDEMRKILKLDNIDIE